jgi:hypothetical protein
MNGSAESIIAKVVGMSIRISTGVGVGLAGCEVWRLPDLARLLDPPVFLSLLQKDLNICNGGHWWVIISDQQKVSMFSFCD